MSTKPVAGIVMPFTSAKVKEDHMMERLGTSKLSLKLVTPPLLLITNLISTCHNIKWDHFEILASGQCNLLCKIKETLLIRDLKPAQEIVGIKSLLLYYTRCSFFGFHCCLASYQYLALVFVFLNTSYFVTVTSEDVCCRIRNVKLNLPCETLSLCL